MNLLPLLITSAIVCVSGLLKIPYFCSLIPLGVFLKQNGLGNLEFLGEIGMFLLFFCIGLELSMDEVWHLLPHIPRALFLNFLMATGLGIVGCFFMPWKIAVFLGIVMSLSSTPLIVGAMKNLNQVPRSFSHETFAIILVQDLMAMGLLIYLGNFQMQGSAWGLVLKMASNFVILTVSWVALRFLGPYFIQIINKRDFYTKMTGILSLLFGSVICSNKLKFSGELGALLCGASLASSKYSLDIEQFITPLKNFLVGCFFLYLGGQIDLVFLGGNYLLVMLVTGIILIIKMFFAAIYSRNYVLTKLLFFSPISEVAMMILTIAIKKGLIAGKISQLLFHATPISLILFPIVIHLFNPLLGDRSSRNFDVVIFGDGPTAVSLYNSFKNKNISTLIISPSIERNIEMSRQNCQVQLGSVDSGVTIKTLFEVYRPQAVVIMDGVGMMDHNALINFLRACTSRGLPIFILASSGRLTEICKKYGAKIIEVNLQKITEKAAEIVSQEVYQLFLTR
jgi:Kef-type K+ transport system membrane component KefB